MLTTTSDICNIVLFTWFLKEIFEKLVILSALSATFIAAITTFILTMFFNLTATVKMNLLTAVHSSAVIHLLKMPVVSFVTRV